jgi:pseudouridine-5'-monophosphatase
VVEHLGLPISPEQYLVEREGLLRELCLQVQPMPGAAELVLQLAALAVPQAVGTSSQRELCELKLAKQHFARHFSCIVCSDDAGILAAKPAPDIFLAVAERLQVQPSKCVVIEDTPNGVRAARAAGMDVIAVVDPNMRGERYDGALHVLDSLEQVSPALLGLG